MDELTQAQIEIDMGFKWSGKYAKVSARRQMCTQ